MDRHDRDINVFVPVFRTEEILDELRLVLDSGWTGAGFRTVDLESEWGREFQHENVLFLNSATAAIHLAILFTKIS